MQKHTKLYMDFFKYGEQDIILCEYCHSRAVDIHHVIFRSQGGKDEISNLVALCRKCHESAHSDKAFNNELKRLR